MTKELMTTFRTLLGALIIFISINLIWTPVTSFWQDPILGYAYADDDDDDGGHSDDDDSKGRSASSGTEGGDSSWVIDEVLAYDLQPDQLQRLRALGFSIIESRELESLGIAFARLRIPYGMSELEAMQQLRRLQAEPGAGYELNHIYQLNSASCQGERCFGQQMIDWPVPGPGSCPSSIRIGMIDTAVDQRHAGLNAAALQSKNFAASGKPSATIHGTAVAGLLAGSPQQGSHGLLPCAQIYSADVFQTDRQGKSHTTAALIAEGINWLVSQQVHVINISLAGPSNKLLEKSISAAHEINSPVVAAAGNNGPDAEPAFPAAYNEVIAVTAVDARLRLYARANRGQYISLAAPGVRVWTPSAKGGTYQNGTSFAAPFVSAAVACLRVKNDAPVGDIEGFLSTAAMDLGPEGKDPLYGWGLLQGTGVCDQ